MKQKSVLEQFKSASVAKRLLKLIDRTSGSFCFMEVCGTHTVQLFKTGVRSHLAKRIRLISGPGCPVCVTAQADIDKAIAIAKEKDVIFCCFGDMVRVPGSYGNLEAARAQHGAAIKVIYSPLEALDLAKENPGKRIVLFGVGFETTVPAFAAVLLRAKKQGLKNLFIYPVFKLVPPALRALLESSETAIDGFILPGHVSAIIGLSPYRFIAEEFAKPAVVAGFEVVDLLEGILTLISLSKKNAAAVENTYGRSVKQKGNARALKIINAVFEETDARWRGLGVIKKSGLRLKPGFRRFDIREECSVKVRASRENPRCLCGSVLKGTVEPNECLLFGKKCTPEHPIGPCMVSAEGTCAAHYTFS